MKFEGGLPADCSQLMTIPLFDDDDDDDMTVYSIITTTTTNNNNNVTYNQCSLKKLRRAAGICHSVLCGTGVPSGVVQKLPSTVTKDAGRLVGCSKCLDRKQQSSCDLWFGLSVAHSVCRRQPTSDADVQQAQPPVGKAQPGTGVLVPADTC